MPILVSGDASTRSCHPRINILPLAATEPPKLMALLVLTAILGTTMSSGSTNAVGVLPGVVRDCRLNSDSEGFCCPDRSQVAVTRVNEMGQEKKKNTPVDVRNASGAGTHRQSFKTCNYHRTLLLITGELRCPNSSVLGLFSREIFVAVRKG